MVISEMIKQVQDITQIKRSDAELVDDFNRGLLDLSSALRLWEQFTLSWQSGDTSHPAPPDVLEFRTWGEFTTPTNHFRLSRVAMDDPQPGWWYDGNAVGLRGPSGAPLARDGTFTIPYLRYPHLLTVGNTFMEPDGGNSVSQALITYACYVAYATLGDEVSIGIANNYRRFYDQAKERIALQRARLMNAPPSSWRRA